MVQQLNVISIIALFKNKLSSLDLYVNVSTMVNAHLLFVEQYLIRIITINSIIVEFKNLV